jgi:MFS family permease
MGNSNASITAQSQKLPQHNALDTDDDLEAIDLDTASDLSFAIDDRPDSSTTPRDVTDDGEDINSTPHDPNPVDIALIRSAPTPLPMKRLLPLIIILLTESITTTMLFPFVGFMVASFGYEKDEVGYYAGFIASCFHLAQFVSSMFWGWLSDKKGRRPILLLGLIGNIVTMLLFGASQNLAMAILARLFSGLLNGNIGVAKTYLGEITDETNQAKGMSIISIAWGVGVIIGPIIGGLMSDPVKQFGWDVWFFRTFPYLLPCLITAVFTSIGLVTGFLYLTETLTQKKLSPSDKMTSLDSVEMGTFEGDEFAWQDYGSKYPRMNRLWQKFRASAFVSLCTDFAPASAIGMYGLLAIISIIFDEVISLFCLTSVELGGIGFDEKRIGVSLIVQGIITIFITLFVTPVLDRKIGPVRTNQLGSVTTAISYFIVPAVNNFVDSTPTLWTVLLLTMAVRTFGNTLVFTSTFVMITNSVTKDRLGSANGLGQSTAALARTFGPAVGGILFAWSLTNGLSYPLDISFVFYLIGTLSLLQTVLAFKLPDRLNKRKMMR